MVFVEVRFLGFQAWLFLLHQKRQELLWRAKRLNGACGSLLLADSKSSSCQSVNLWILEEGGFVRVNYFETSHLEGNMNRKHIYILFGTGTWLSEVWSSWTYQVRMGNQYSTEPSFQKHVVFNLSPLCLFPVNLCKLTSWQVQLILQAASQAESTTCHLNGKHSC